MKLEYFYSNLPCWGHRVMNILLKLAGISNKTCFFILVPVRLQSQSLRTVTNTYEIIRSLKYTRGLNNV
jgi:hypothetical protein